MSPLHVDGKSYTASSLVHVLNSFTGIISCQLITPMIGSYGLDKKQWLRYTRRYRNSRGTDRLIDNHPAANNFHENISIATSNISSRFSYSNHKNMKYAPMPCLPTTVENREDSMKERQIPLIRCEVTKTPFYRYSSESSIRATWKTGQTFVEFLRCAVLNGSRPIICRRSQWYFLVRGRARNDLNRRKIPTIIVNKEFELRYCHPKNSEINTTIFKMMFNKLAISACKFRQDKKLQLKHQRDYQ